MNYSVIFYILGHILKFEGIFLLLPMVVGMIYREEAFIAYLICAILCYVLGLLITRKKPVSRQLYTKEGLLTVALGWIVLSIFGALPFVIAGDIPSYINALFETISGFTTTGASILPEVEPLSRSSLFWRSFTHWIGGMGVFVFLLAITPLMGSTMNLMKAESPGPSVDKLVPRVKDTAKILYGIYLFITIAEILLLIIFGMPIFDALTLSFGTTGTGGFGIRNDSLAGYSPILQNIVTVFMILSGVNYNAYFLIISKKLKDAFRIEEVRWYFLIIFVSAGIITVNTCHMYPTISETIRHAFFQVGSIITTTGFGTTDFDLWPQISKTILIILMCIGACAGSTGGGIKVSRLVILFKTIRKELSLMIHPREIRKIRMDNHCVKHEVLRAVNVFMIVYFVIMFISVLLISIDNFGFTTNFTAVLATLNNIGPGLELVGPTRNFNLFSPFSKFVLMFDMLAGRLELFPMLLLIMPTAWKRK
ncbi:MAG: TrkH family potassium uptake protein [Lachnospiraceae bacterium]